MITIKHKANRERLARDLHALAVEFGASFICEDDGARCLRVHVKTVRGLSVLLWLDAADRDPDLHCLHWHMDVGSAAKLRPTFGNVNEYHHQKATHAARGSVGLLDSLRRSLTAAADGSAFWSPASALAVGATPTEAAQYA